LSANLHIGTAELVKNKELSPTASVVLQLAKTLPYTTYEFSVFCDNLFTKSKLFSQLRVLGIGACGTARADVTLPLFSKIHETWKPAWGTLWSQIQDNDTGSGVLISLWQDSGVVKLATTIHQGTEWVVQERKKPRDSSSSAAITKAPFEVFPTIRALKPAQTGRKKQEYVHVRPLPIPKMVDDYNHFMNGVDIADQLRATFTTEQQTSRTWMPLFYYLLDTAICNAYILSEHYRKSKPSYDPKKRIRGTHRAFRKALIDALLLQYKVAPTRIYTNPRHLPISRLDQPIQIHMKKKASYPGKCLFCRFSKDMCQVRLGHIGGIGTGMKVRMTRTLCNHCGIYLCGNCFNPFHKFKSVQ